MAAPMGQLSFRWSDGRSFAIQFTAPSAEDLAINASDALQKFRAVSQLPAELHMKSPTHENLWLNFHRRPSGFFTARPFTIALGQTVQWVTFQKLWQDAVRTDEYDRELSRLGMAVTYGLDKDTPA